MNKVRQCTLKCGNKRMTSWIDAKVKAGNRVSLDDEEGVWTVVSISSIKDMKEIKAHNDRVHGGMFGSIL